MDYIYRSLKFTIGWGIVGEWFKQKEYEGL